jgi:hypothetical protein
MSTRIPAYLKQQHLALLCLLLIATGGTAYAAGKIGSKQIKTGAVKGKHVKDRSLQQVDLAPGTGAAPAGAVGFFNLAACPAGWSEFTQAQGRYVVGTPAGGANAGTAGTALSNLEDRPVGQHGHAVTDPGHTHGFDLPMGSTDGGNASGGFDAAAPTSLRLQQTTQRGLTGISINDAGSVSGTNAPYIQLRVCQKT